MVVQTRNQKKMDGLEDLIDKKLSELKDVLVHQFQASLDSYISVKKDELETFFSEKRKDLDAIKISEAAANTEIQDSILSIKRHVAAVKAENILLRKEVDELRQYIRRPNVRIFGVPISSNEKSSAVENLIKSMLPLVDGISSSSIDRAHRVGRITSKEIKSSTNKGENGGDGENGDEGENGGDGNKGVVTVVKSQPIIVRFTSFRDRTIFYRSRKVIKDKFKCTISLDLTMDRYALLKYARNKVLNVDGIKFVYSDINCALRAFTEGGKHLVFDSASALDEIISAVSPV